MMSRPTRSLAAAQRFGEDSHMSRWTRKAIASAIAAAALALPSCSHTVTGTAIPKSDPIDAVISGEATPNIAAPTPTPNDPFDAFPPGGKLAEGTPRSLGSMPPPHTMSEAVQRTVSFWRTKSLPMVVRTEAAQSPLGCNAQTSDAANATFCNGTVIYDSAWANGLLNAPPHGVVALEIVAAHEVGHAVQYDLGFDGDLDKSPYVGTMNAQEVAADCLSGVYMKSTGVPTADLDRALALTALGGNAVREQAFHNGLVETNPQNCIDRFLG